MEEFHYKLLKVLQENPDLSQRELTRKVGLSLGKTNYCMRVGEIWRVLDKRMFRR